MSSREQQREDARQARYEHEEARAVLAAERAPERVIVLDPGERVGWARMEIDREARAYTFLGWGVTPLKPMALALYRQLPNYDTVVYETWRLRPKAARTLIGNDMLAPQFIGMVRLLAWVHDVQLVPREPKQKFPAIAAMPDSVSALMVESTEEHDKDAIQLGFSYIMTLGGHQWTHLNPTED